MPITHTLHLLPVYLHFTTVYHLSSPVMKLTSWSFLCSIMSPGATGFGNTPRRPFYVLLSKTSTLPKDNISLSIFFQILPEEPYPCTVNKITWLFTLHPVSDSSGSSPLTISSLNPEESLVKTRLLSFSLLCAEDLNSRLLRNYVLLETWTLLKLKTIG